MSDGVCVRVCRKAPGLEQCFCLCSDWPDEVFWRHLLRDLAPLCSVSSALGLWSLVHLFPSRSVCVCMCACACVRACVGAWVRGCMHACVRACVRVCVCVGCEHMPIGTGAHMHHGACQESMMCRASLVIGVMTLHALQLCNVGVLQQTLCVCGSQATGCKSKLV